MGVDGMVRIFFPREDLKITFNSNPTLKLSVDVTVSNPSSQCGVEGTLNSVVERARSKNSVSPFLILGALVPMVLAGYFVMSWLNN